MEWQWTAKCLPSRNSKCPGLNSKKKICSLFLTQYKLLFYVCPSVIVLCHLYGLALFSNLSHFPCGGKYWEKNEIKCLTMYSFVKWWFRLDQWFSVLVIHYSHPGSFNNVPWTPEILIYLIFDGSWILMHWKRSLNDSTVQPDLRAPELDDHQDSSMV